MRLRFTPRAFSDLDDIRLYIHRRNPVAAGKVVAVIETVARRLGEFPDSGQRSDEGDVRVVFATRYPYRIYCRILSDEILILHIRHTSRRPVESGIL